MGRVIRLVFVKSARIFQNLGFSLGIYSLVSCGGHALAIASDRPEWWKATQSSSIIEKSQVLLPGDELVFFDETNKQKKLSEFFALGRPVLLSLVYYNCPSACTVILNGAMKALREVNLHAGEDYEVLVVSILPTEGPELARRKKAVYMKMLGQPESEKGWHFLTGTAENVIRLAYLVGFSFMQRTPESELLHDAGVFFVSPEGKLTRTLFGAQFKPDDMKHALIEASGDRIGSVSDRVSAFFTRYDHFKRTYRIDWIRAGAANGLLLVGLLSPVALRFRRARSRQAKE